MRFLVALFFATFFFAAIAFLSHWGFTNQVRPYLRPGVSAMFESREVQCQEKFGLWISSFVFRVCVNFLMLPGVRFFS